MSKMINIIFLQIIILIVPSLNSQIRQIPLEIVSDDFEILINQSISETISFNCIYDSNFNKSVKINIEHKNGYFCPSKKIHNLSEIIYNNLIIDNYLILYFEFEKNIIISKNIICQLFFNQFKLIQREDNTLFYKDSIPDYHIDKSIITEYSLINEIINKCDNDIKSYFIQLFYNYLDGISRIYQSDNEFIIEKMKEYFDLMTDYKIYDKETQEYYKGKINNCKYENYSRINDKIGIFNNVNIVFELENDYYLKRKSYNIIIDNIKMNIEEKKIDFGSLKTSELYAVISMLLPQIIREIFNIVLSKIQNS